LHRVNNPEFERRSGSPIDVGIDSIGIVVAMLLINRFWPRPVP
jgi:hypothetical protein